MVCMGDKENVIYITSMGGKPERRLDVCVCVCIYIYSSERRRFEDIRTDDRKILTWILKTGCEGMDCSNL
jgi:hypothetical protein